MGQASPSISALRKAVETRDAASLKAFYAPDAVLTVIDSDHPPSNPLTFKGASAIGGFLDDVYGRDMTHKLEYGVADGTHLAFVQGCAYPNGAHVVASSTAELGPDGIRRQTTVQAWDS